MHLPKKLKLQNPPKKNHTQHNFLLEIIP
jgi:hypothetical protein